MKKLNGLREVFFVLISVLIITISTTTFATGVLDGDNNSTPISKNEYDNAQTVTEKNTNTQTTNNANTSNIENSSNKTNNVKVSINNSSSNLPQTGIEDYNIGILLIICVTSAIFAYKKINDYRNI